MLIIEKLVMQGFKSFKRRVSIPLPPGFSCITGPNGSGKTNILDAICFVLGRTSSRTLRAQKTQNLIFHGSKVKDSAEFATVMIHFNNRGKELPFEEDCVSISRRVNRSSVSTYRLNGKVVTRQQILDAFSQAGIQPNGHNIIQQGDVNHIVEMDAVERRGVLDEISGIAEFDDKKNKAMKELAKADERVKDAGIILEQRQMVMEKLRSERDAALNYKKLETMLSKIRASLVWMEKNKSEASLKEILSKLGKKEKEFERLGHDIDNGDSKITTLESRMESIAKSAMKLRGQIEAAKKAAQLESELELKKGQIEANKREIERIGTMQEQLSTITGRYSPALQHIKDFKGVHGTVADLVKVPGQYKVAVEVSAGAHLSDIVVDDVNTAVACVKHLKKNRIGRARFLPMDKVRMMGSRFLPKEAIGWMGDLVRYSPEYIEVMGYVFGSTACVKNIDTAKGISRKQRIRMVTLDGDLMEASGAITGGFYKSKDRMPGTGKYEEQAKGLENENVSLAKEIFAVQKELELYAKQKKPPTIKEEVEQARIDVELKRVREKRKHSYEKRLTIQQEIGRLNIERAKLEARFGDLKVRSDNVEGFKKEELEMFIVLGADALGLKQKKVIQGIHDLGPVNLKALHDFDNLNNEFEEFKEKVNTIVRERQAVMSTLSEIESKRLTTFNKTLSTVSRNFKEVYMELAGGTADLILQEEGNVDSGLLIQAQPPGKKLLNIDSMSGGEKTITAFAFLFAIQRHRPAPFYVLDEADAALDKTNTKRVVDLLRKQSKDAQFIVISHNDSLVKEADQVYGVSMESGESKIFGVKLPRDN